MRNAGSAIVFTDSRKKDVIGKSSSIGKFPEGTVLASNSCSMMPTNTDIKFFTTSTPYSPDTKDPLFRIKEEIREELNYGEVSYRKKVFFESRFMSLINKDNAKDFKKNRGVLISFYRYVLALPTIEMVEVSKDVPRHLQEYCNGKYRQGFTECKERLDEQHQYFTERGRTTEARDALIVLNRCKKTMEKYFNDASVDMINFNRGLRQGR